MAANSNTFDRILDHLLEVYHVSTTRKLQCTNVIKDCHKLFQSWPQESREEPSQCKDQPKTGITSTGLEGDTTTQTMSASELAALELADKALVQAQKMRCKQAKLLEKESSLNKATNNQVNSPRRGDTVNEKNPNINNSADSLPTRTSSAVSDLKSASHKQQPPAGTAPVKEMQSYHGRKISSASDRSRTFPSHSRIESKLNNNKARTNLSGKTDGRGTTMTGRPTDGIATVGVISQSSLKKVLGQTSSAGKSRYTPAHSTAPFKTDPPLSQRGGSRKTTRTNVSVHRTEKKKHEALKPTSSQQHVEDVTRQTNTMVLSRRTGDMNRESDQSADSSSVFTMNQDRQPDKTEKLMNDMEKLELDKDTSMPKTKDLQTSHNLNEQEKQNCPVEKSMPFDLLSEGGSLTVPVKLRRAIASNRKLRQQVQTSAVTVHAKEDISSAGWFLEKLNAHYYSQEAEAGNIFKMVVQMTALYKCYCGIMGKYQGVDLQVTSSWQEVLRVKRTMENICLAFADMEDNYNHILDCFGQTIDDKGQTKVVSPSWEAQPSILWLPQPSATEYLAVPRTMRYRKVSHIEQYQSLVHQLQLLQLQTHLVTMCETTFLPLLTAMGPSHRLFSMLYRATYSLLCSNGRHLPMIITDDTEDDTAEASICHRTSDS